LSPDNEGEEIPEADAPQEEQASPTSRQIVRGVILIEELDAKGQSIFKAEPMVGFQNIYELLGWMDLRWQNVGVIKQKLVDCIQERRS